MTSTNEKGKRPLDLSKLSKSEFNREIQKGFDYSSIIKHLLPQKVKRIKESKSASAFHEVPYNCYTRNLMIVRHFFV